MKLLNPLLIAVPLLFSACIKERPPVDVPGDYTLNGEINPVETRVVINDADLKYDWSKTPTKSLVLYFRNAAGTKQMTSTVTLNIQSNGYCTFTAALPSWYPEETWVAGAIDVTPGSAAQRFNLAQPSSIAVGPTNDYYLPMYFPLTKIVNVNGVDRVSVAFTTFGSMLRFDVTNNLSTSYEVVTNALKNSMVRVRGTMDWTGKGLGQVPGWTTSSAANNDTINTFNISNMILAPGATKTFYVWVKQEANLRGPFTANVRAVNGVNPSVALRPAPSDSLKNNKFYRISLPINPELMITEVFEGPGYQSCMIELYNPGTAPIQLSNYYLRESSFWLSSIQLPAYSLPAGGLVVLATAATPSREKTTYVAAGATILTLDASANDLLGDPFTNYYQFILRKFDDVSQLNIDRINCDTWGGINGAANRLNAISLPQVTFNSTQWARTTFGNSELGLR